MTPHHQQQVCQLHEDAVVIHTMAGCPLCAKPSDPDLEAELEDAQAEIEDLKAEIADLKAGLK
jgi:cell division protein FtsB